MLNFTHYLSYQIHGGADSDGGIISSLEKLLVNVEALLAKEPAEMFSTLLPGVTSLANIHPLFVHFPIALLTLFFLIDFSGSLFRIDTWRQTASWFLYLGTIAALTTVAMGLQAAATVPHGAAAHEIMMQHKMYGFSIAGLSVFLSLWRLLAGGYIRGLANVLNLGLAALLCILITLSADLGGLMVFKYGVGVSTHRPSVSSSTQHEH